MGPLVSKIVFRPPKRITIKHKEKLSWTKTKNNLKVPILTFTPDDEYEEDFQLVHVKGLTSTSESESFCPRSWSYDTTNEEEMKKKEKTNRNKKSKKKKQYQLTETETESSSELEDESLFSFSLLNFPK